MPDPALLQPAFEAAIEAKNFVFHELQGESTTIELFGLAAGNKAGESVKTLKENWMFRQVNIGMGVWRDEFQISEGAISAEEMDRVAYVEKDGIRYTVDSKARPNGLRRFWSLMMKPIQRVTS